MYYVSIFIIFFEEMWDLTHNSKLMSSKAASLMKKYGKNGQTMTIDEFKNAYEVSIDRN